MPKTTQRGNALDATESADHCAVVTPSDSADLANWALALKIGATGGVVKVDTWGGETDVEVPVAAHDLLPIKVKRVRATGTTATPIVALW